MIKILGLVAGTFILFAVLLFAGCRASNPELEKNKQLWLSSNVANYDFVVTKYQGGMYTWVPVLVKVRSGAVISLEPTEERLELQKIDGHEDFDTIEKSFDQIRAVYERGDRIGVTYNQQLGYPERINIRPARGGTDSGFSMVVSKFEIVKSP